MLDMLYLLDLQSVLWSLWYCDGTHNRGNNYLHRVPENSANNKQKLTD